jgi:hypothetical protein
MKKILFLGVVAILLSLGLVLASCNGDEEEGKEKCSDGGACYYDLVNDVGWGCGEDKCGVYNGRPKCNC